MSRPDARDMQRDLFRTIGALDDWIRHCRDTIARYQRQKKPIPSDTFNHLLRTCPRTPTPHRSRKP